VDDKLVIMRLKRVGLMMIVGLDLGIYTHYVQADWIMTKHLDWLKYTYFIGQCKDILNQLPDSHQLKKRIYRKMFVV
jgi:hypothetical protein